MAVSLYWFIVKLNVSCFVSGYIPMVYDCDFHALQFTVSPPAVYYYRYFFQTFFFVFGANIVMVRPPSNSSSVTVRNAL
jgi:hypothetical protein